MTSIDCKGLKGMREIAAHRYKTMQSRIIWTTATEHIPEIEKYLKQQKEIQQQFKSLDSSIKVDQ